MAKRKLVIVGGGKMGEAILAGWLACESGPARELAPADVVVVDPGEERRAQLRGRYGVECVADVSGAPAAELVVLAVKPQVLMGVLAGIASLEAFGGGQMGPLFVSIAAGVPTGRISAALPEGSAVVRVMPNMPLQVGAGASGVCAGHGATDQQVARVAELFGSLGRAVVVDEACMDAVCALSGSGPAYVAALVEHLRDAAARQGLDASLAESLALQTVLGTAKLIDETDLSPQAAREAVCSPGGTTLAALEAMEAAGFADAIDAGVAAAVVRSRELAECS